MNAWALRNVVNFKRLQWCRGQVLLSEARGEPVTKAREMLKEAEAAFEEDGHTGGSYYWTLKQSNAIDVMGWEKWLKTDDAISKWK